MDCTGRANRQRRDLFISVIILLRGNVTCPMSPLFQQVFFCKMLLVIKPKSYIMFFYSTNAGKNWVFCYIFKYIFLQFYGEITCRINRLTLTDEDPVEYKTFENITKIHDNYNKSLIMLCMLHAIWKPFKETICSLLPKKEKLLTPVGYE